LTYRLTKDADGDVARILKDTYRLFGRSQVVRYAEIIKRGLSMVAENPLRASSRPRDELNDGMRSFHLQLASGRSKGASHVIYYRIASTNPELVIVVRVVGDEMEPKKRVAQALRSDDAGMAGGRGE